MLNVNETQLKDSSIGKDEAKVQHSDNKEEFVPDSESKTKHFRIKLLPCEKLKSHPLPQQRKLRACLQSIIVKEESPPPKT